MARHVPVESSIHCQHFHRQEAKVELCPNTQSEAGTHLGLACYAELLSIGVPQGQVLPALRQQGPHLLQALLPQLCRICTSTSPWVKPWALLPLHT